MTEKKSQSPFAPWSYRGRCTSVVCALRCIIISLPVSMEEI